MRGVRAFGVLVGLTALVAAGTAGAGASTGVAEERAASTTTEAVSVPGQLLVGYRLGTSASDRANARAHADAVLLDQVVADAPGRAAVELVAYRNVDRGEAERRFTADPHVEYAEPNWVYTTDATADDPYFTNGSLWGMEGDNSSPTNQYGSQAAEAWAAGNTGSNSVYVGIIDEGFQFEHPDLDANIWTNALDPVDGIDNDNNGFIDDIHGWDFNSNDNTVYDGTGDDHGTHVAGTIGAEGNNSTGVAGVNWNVTLIDAKFLGPNGGTTANAVKAVDYLTDLKVRNHLNIVATNNSWGGGGYSQALFDAIGRAGKANILFIAAAGNGGNDGRGDNIDTSPSYPAAYSNPNIIAVAAINSTGGLASWSNYGAMSVDLAAPGVGIWSTVPTNSYASYSGTSMATPHVTGAAALYASTHTSATASDIKSAILGSTDATSSVAGKTVTGGRLDIGTLIGSTAGGGNTLSVSVAPSCGSPASAVTCTFTATAGFTTYSWTGAIATTTANVATQQYGSPGTYSATVVVTDGSGGTGSGSASVTCSWATRGKNKTVSCRPA
jgi:subtilisin family serine protease